MDESRTADASALTQSPPSRIPVRAISLAIVLAMVLYVGMATLADWGAFALTLTPGKAGETVRSVYLYPYGVSYPKSIGAFIAERLLDLVAVGALASLAISMFPEHRLWLLGAIVCSVTVILLLRSRLLSLAVKRLAKGSLGSHAAQGTSLYLIVEALGHDLPTVTVIGIYCVSILAGEASFIPGGLGATEAAIALLLSAAGVSQTDAITAAVISRGLNCC